MCASYEAALSPTGQFDLKNFHDIVLLNGSLPLYVIEELMEEDIKARTGGGKPLPVVEAAASGSHGAGSQDAAGDAPALHSLGLGLGLGLGLALGVAIAKARR